jgi:hypothetical protein
MTYVVYYSSNIDTDYVDDNKAIVNDDDAKDTSAIPTGDDDYGDGNGDQNPLSLLKQHRVNEFLLSLLGKIDMID